MQNLRGATEGCARMDSCKQRTLSVYISSLIPSCAAPDHRTPCRGEAAQQHFSLDEGYGWGRSYSLVMCAYLGVWTGHPPSVHLLSPQVYSWPSYMLISMECCTPLSYLLLLLGYTQLKGIKTALWEKLNIVFTCQKSKTSNKTGKCGLLISGGH